MRFKNFSIGIFLTNELRKVKGIVEANPHIGKKIQTNKYKYVMSTTKAVLYYEIIENSENIVFYEYKPFKQNKDMQKDTCVGIFYSGLCTLLNSSSVTSFAGNV